MWRRRDGCIRHAAQQAVRMVISAVDAATTTARISFVDLVESSELALFGVKLVVRRVLGVGGIHHFEVESPSATSSSVLLAPQRATSLSKVGKERGEQSA